MKLAGIKSSKSRRAVSERNRDLKAPAANPGALSARHKPIARPDGALLCEGCAGQAYSPACFAAHLSGDARGLDSFNGVLVLPNDPWAAAQMREPTAEQSQADRAAEALREKQIDAYHAQRKRAPKMAQHVGHSEFFD